jgi:hypothetical protein
MADRELIPDELRERAAERRKQASRGVGAAFDREVSDQGGDWWRVFITDTMGTEGYIHARVPGYEVAEMGRLGKEDREKIERLVEERLTPADLPVRERAQVLLDRSPITLGGGDFEEG